MDIHWHHKMTNVYIKVDINNGEGSLPQHRKLMSMRNGGMFEGRVSRIASQLRSILVWLDYILAVDVKTIELVSFSTGIRSDGSIDFSSGSSKVYIIYAHNCRSTSWDI